MDDLGLETELVPFFGSSPFSLESERFISSKSPSLLLFLVGGLGGTAFSGELLVLPGALRAGKSNFVGSGAGIVIPIIQSTPFVCCRRSLLSLCCV